MFPKDKDSEHGLGEENMPSDAQEKTPGVYVRAENELPHELDMLWSNAKHYQREDRSPVVSFIAGFVIGAILTGAVFTLFFSHPEVKTGNNDLATPVTESAAPGSPASKNVLNTAEPAHGPAGSAANTSYTVTNGDTLGRIAEKVYGSSAPKYIEKIQRANNMKTPDSLQLSQKLVIPPKDY